MATSPRAVSPRPSRAVRRELTSRDPTSQRTDRTVFGEAPQAPSSRADPFSPLAPLTVALSRKERRQEGKYTQ